VKNVGHTVLQCSHRCVDERFSSQSFPWEFDIYAAMSVVKWYGVTQLGRPMRALEIELFRDLGEPGELGERCFGMFPVDLESNPLSVSSRSSVGFVHDVEKICNAFRFLWKACGPVSCGQS
jgi:hypothetical protein